MAEHVPSLVALLDAVLIGLLGLLGFLVRAIVRSLEQSARQQAALGQLLSNHFTDDQKALRELHVQMTLQTEILRFIRDAQMAQTAATHARRERG